MTLSPKKKAAIFRLRGHGLTQKDIAGILHISQQVVSYQLKIKRRKFYRRPHRRRW